MFNGASSLTSSHLFKQILNELLQLAEETQSKERISLEAIVHLIPM